VNVVTTGTVLALVFAVVVPLGLRALKRRLGGDDTTLGRVAAGFIVVLLACDLAIRFRDGRGWGALPMQLCDWAMIASAITLATRSRLAFEVTYFWGLSGTVQAILTPGFSGEIAWWRWAGYFLNHAVIVASTVYCMIARGQRPRWSSLICVMAVSQIYFALALVVNAVGNENFGFLAAKPATTTLLSVLSDDLFLYRLQIQGLALLFFTVLYLPWVFWDAVGTARGRQQEPE
jgi:hypothetical integral membrane protein (TIGR02206 family)